MHLSEAISTLLQPPIVRTGLLPHTAITSSGYKPPSTKDIPPVTLTNIRHIEPKAFEQYLAQVGSLFDAFQRAKEGGEDDDFQLLRGSRSPVSRDEFSVLKTPKLERRVSGIHNNSRGTSPLDARASMRVSSGRLRGPHSVAPLSTIPNVYFDEDFHLENPRTFDVVSERSEVVRQPMRSADEKLSNGGAIELSTSGRKALATNAILQEKLSWYMDTVEIHLISSISTASKSFFTALGSLQDLHAEAAESVKRIQILRRDLNKIDSEMALGGLKVVNLRRRRENIRKLADAVAQLQEVVEAVSQCAELVEKGEIEDALEGVDEVERLMSGEQISRLNIMRDAPTQDPRQSVDLRGIKALQGASNDLALLRQRIGMGYESRFLDDLLGDLQQHVANAPADVTLQRWGASFQRNRGGHRSMSSISPTYLSFDAELRSRLRVQLIGLGRTHYTMPAATSFKTAILREMKALIRKHLPSSSDDDNVSIMSGSTHGTRQLSQQEKSSLLARNLRAMDSNDAYKMLRQIYTGVSESLRRLSVQVKVLLDITSALGGTTSAAVRSPSRSPSIQNIDNVSRSQQGLLDAVVAQEEILQVLDMSSLLGQAVDIVQSQIVKVLKVRSEQTSRLSLEDFLRYFSLNRLFADECEAISGRSGTTLKTIVDSQIRDFVAKFSDGQRHRIVEVMDADKWEARDFGDAENRILFRILRASTSDVDHWLQPSKIWLHPEEKETDFTSALNGAPANGSGKEKVRTAVVDEQRYILPESAIIMMKSMDEFASLTINIPSMVQDVVSNLVECLKLFNSRSSQLILGAGATRSAGLKNITTKHLALSSQALSFVIALIPYVREFVRRTTSSTQILTEFDKVKRLCQDHQTGIHEKLVDIMSSRAAVHVTTMAKIEWDDRGSQAVSPYMETLTKETGTLHRNLTKHLPEATVRMIMDPIFKSYRDQWSKAFQEAKFKTEEGKDRFVKFFFNISTPLSV